MSYSSSLASKLNPVSHALAHGFYIYLKNNMLGTWATTLV